MSMKLINLPSHTPTNGGPKFDCLTNPRLTWAHTSINKCIIDVYYNRHVEFSIRYTQCKRLAKLHCMHVLRNCIYLTFIIIFVSGCTSPEDGRPRGGGPGADGGNYRQGSVHPPSKIDGTKAIPVNKQ